jgi:hypothetical protein
MAVSSHPPVLPAEITQFFVPPSGSSTMASLTYYPRIAAACEVTYSNARFKVQHTEKTFFLAEAGEGPAPVDWEQAESAELELEELSRTPPAGASFADCPAPLQKAKSYQEWNRQLGRWIRTHRTLSLRHSKTCAALSHPGETEGDFRVRLSQIAREQRDGEVELLRRKYSSRLVTLQERVRRAEQAVEREAEQSRQKKMETAFSFGTAVLGAFLGRKAVSVSTASRVGTAMRSASRMGKEAQDVERARENAEAAQAEITRIETELQQEMERVSLKWDPRQEVWETVTLQPKTTDIFIRFFGLLWVPYQRDENSRWVRAF